MNTVSLTSIMCDKTKGSRQNRAKCALAQTGNELKTAALTAGVVGGAYFAATNPEKISKAVTTAQTTISPYVQKFLNSNVGKKAVELLNKAKTSNIGQKVLSYINKGISKALPLLNDAKADLGKAGSWLINTAKAHPVLAGVTVAALTLIGINHAFNAGKIDQQYTDKAKYENA